MSHVVTITCDCCGARKADPPEKPWWDFMYSSMDFPIRGGGAEFKSGSWDLCPDCSSRARAALVDAIGEPSHDSDELE